jgi:transcriptional regulator with XRE-family HTH domain
MARHRFQLTMFPERKKQIRNEKVLNNKREFARIIYKRRREFNFSQRYLAEMTKVSAAYISRLEAGRTHPSPHMVGKLAEELLLDQGQLMALVNPTIVNLINSDQEKDERSAWNKFRNDTILIRSYRLTSQEIDLLDHIATMGMVRRPRDFIYILMTVRNALAKPLTGR